MVLNLECRIFLDIKDPYLHIYFSMVHIEEERHVFVDMRHWDLLETSHGGVAIKGFDELF